MPERSDRSRSPKRVGEGVAWPGLRASLERVHDAVKALLSRGEAEADYLSNTERIQLKQHLDRIAEDVLQLAKPKEGDEMISKPAQLGVVNLNRTKSQAAGQQRIEYVRSQFNECQVPMTKLVRSVSLWIKDPVPSDVGRLRETLNIVERGQKEARNYGEDLLQFMVDLDNISGLIDEDRNFRRNTMKGIDALLANIDDARSGLLHFQEMLQRELNKRADHGVPLAKLASEESQSKDALRSVREAETEVPKINSHAAVLETASLKRMYSEWSRERKSPDEHQVPMSRLARSASLIQEVDALLSNIKKASTEPAHENKVAANCANVGQVDTVAARQRSQEEQHKAARRTESVGKARTSTQPPLLVPSGPPTIFAPRSAASYARMAF